MADRAATYVNVVSPKGLVPPLAVDHDEFFAASGDGLVVVFVVVGPDGPRTGSWLHLSAEGTVTVHVGKVEVGQGIRTSLTQLVAEDLRVPLDSVHLMMGDTRCTPYDIGTFSSLTIRTIGNQLRRTAAMARQVVLRLAAETRAEDQPVGAGWSDPHWLAGRALEFSKVVAGRRVVEAVTNTDAVTPPTKWTIAGQPISRVGAFAVVTGRHRYPSDLALPGVRHGKVLRAPVHGALLESVDTRGAETMTAVTVVRDRDLVGVTAPDAWSANRALAAIKATWSTVSAESCQPSHADVFAYLRDHPVDVPGRGGPVKHVAGSLEAGWAIADITLRETYTASYVAHAPMEPRAAMAVWCDGELTVWTGTQRPFAVRTEVAQALDISERRIRIVVPDTGSAFGGKHTGEAAVEAALLARSDGHPVKVVWSRAEEFTCAYFRPAAVIDVASGSKNGTLTAWECHCYNAGAEGLRPPYAVSNQHVEFHPAHSPLRQGPYRGLAATANHFARETHLDEMARALRLDPIELRRRNLDDPRLLAVLEAAAESFDWGGARPLPGQGFGIACGVEKGGYVATCAEVRVSLVGEPDAGRVKVIRVVEAFECGAIVNPEHLRAQVEGAVIQGLGGALFEAVEFADGQVRNYDFTRYRVPRFADVPTVEVVLLDRTDLPSVGAGECPIVGIAPALGNAIFEATGVRLRTLPLAPHGVSLCD